MDRKLELNPYDFANPVSDSRRFYGRDSEMTDIKYYLDHALTAARPINLALIGDRAAGKTSVMNIAEQEAITRNFCTVRVDLDEADSQHSVVFFYKIFDAILHSAFAYGAFGGFEGKTYEVYLHTITGLDSGNSAALFKTFLFPSHYSICVRTNNYGTPLSDSAIKHDLKLIAKELSKPIVIFFDESNVLSSSRVLLEKLRNIFMNLSGYMLVIAGTPEMFPVIDDVFSPIIRQFKKIQIGAFASVNETTQCITQPLRDADIKVQVNMRTISEIHELSSGRPYEIQLICHLLFKSLQKTGDRRMELDYRALEALRNELAQSQNIGGRAILSQMANLSRKDLNHLKILTRCNEHASVETLQAIARMFLTDGVSTAESLQASLNMFIERQILHLANGLVTFTGDYFDRLYAKYYAREQGIILNLDATTIPQAMAAELRMAFRPAIGTLRQTSIDFLKELRIFNNSLQSEDSDLGTLLASGPASLEHFYFRQIKNQGQPSFEVTFLRCRINEHIVVLVAENDTNITPEAPAGAAKGLAERAASVGAEFEISSVLIDVVPIDRLRSSVLKSPDFIREKISDRHFRRAIDAFRAQHLEEAKLELRLSIEYFDAKDSKTCNDRGYMKMVTGDWDEAESFLRKALILANDVLDHMLVRYNLACIEIHRQAFGMAKVYVAEALSREAELPHDDDLLACLLIPKIVDAGIGMVEEEEPRLIGSLHLVEGLLDTLLTPPSHSSPDSSADPHHTLS